MTAVEPLVDTVLRPGRDGSVGIIAALVEAMRNLPPVGKDSEHVGDKGDGPSTGRWNYRSADAVVSAAGPALAKAGVVCIPNVAGETPTKLGSLDAIRLAMEYRFFATDGSSVTVNVVSHGVGRTAYTIGAAYSYAFKYALSQALAIPFDDPRMDMESDDTDREMRAEAARPWWDRGGWPNEQAHGTRRQALLRRLQELPSEHQRAAKRWLAEQSTYTIWDANGRSQASGIWIPVRVGAPDGPGMLAAGLSLEAMNAADAYVEDLMNTAALEAAGAEPWDDANEVAVPLPANDDPGRTVPTGVTVDDLVAAGRAVGKWDGRTPLGVIRKRLVKFASECGVAVDQPEQLIADQAVAEELLVKLSQVAE